MNIAEKYNLIICLLLNFGFIQITNAQNPNWSVNSASYPLDASIIGALKIDGEYTSNTNNLIAAFDENNTIRGLAKLSFIAALNKYVFFMTIYGNKGGTTFSFRVYDANQDIVVLVPRTSIKFTPNEISGSLDNPFLIEAETNILPSVKTFSHKYYNNSSKFKRRSYSTRKKFSYRKRLHLLHRRFLSKNWRT